MSDCVNKIKSGLNIREKLGQLLMLDFRYWGKENSEPVAFTEMNEDVAALIKDYNLGGIALFRENCETTEQLTKLTHDMQCAANIPLIIGVDQEGGVVTRLQTGTDMPGNMALGAVDDIDLTETVAEVIACELKAVGINMNFAPDIDVNSNPENPIIGNRAFSSDPAKVAIHGAAYIRGLKKVGVMPSVKHFPGHGNTATDTHLGLATVNYTVKELSEIDLVPFKMAVAENAETFMAAHVTVPALDSTTYVSKKDGREIGVPTTLSKKILTDLLRSKMNYKGVVLTDAMDMKAISDNFGGSDSVILSILAGADMQVMAVRVWGKSDIYKLTELIDILENEYDKNSEFRKRVEESLDRILALKEKQNLLVKNQTVALEEKLIEAESIVACSEHKTLEKEVSERAVTLLKNENSILPISLNDDIKIIILDSSISRMEVAKHELYRLCKSLNVSPEINLEKINFSSEFTDQIKNKLQHADFILLNTYNLKTVDLLPEKVCSFAKDKNIDCVVMSCRNPYDINMISSCQAYLAIYGASGFDQTNYKQSSLKINIETAVRTIFTAEKASKLFNKPSGKLPVDVSDNYKMGFGLEYK